MCSGTSVFGSSVGFAESEPEGTPGVGADTDRSFDILPSICAALYLYHMFI